MSRITASLTLRVTTTSRVSNGASGFAGWTRIQFRTLNHLDIELFMPQAVRVADVSEIPAGSAREVVAGDQVIALFNVDGQLYAIDGVCAHSGGPLANGDVTGTRVTCPWHGWQFDVATGTNCLAPRIKQMTFKVRVEGSDVFVDLP